MAKYSGKIGFINQIESAPGVWIDDISERSYRGDIIRNTQRWSNTEDFHDDLVVSNQISIIADIYAFTNFPHIKYVSWYGQKWKATAIEVKRPRLLITLGGLYNG